LHLLGFLPFGEPVQEYDAFAPCVRRRDASALMSTDQNFQAWVVFELDGTPVAVFETEDAAKAMVAEVATSDGPFYAYKETPICGEPS
jgi:hypothetical protein